MEQETAPEAIPEPPKEKISGYDSTLLAAVGAVKAIKSFAHPRTSVPVLAGGLAEALATPAAVAVGPAAGTAVLSGAGATGTAIGEGLVMGGETLLGNPPRNAYQRILEAAALGAVPDMFRLAKFGLKGAGRRLKREVTPLGLMAKELYGETTSVAQLLNSPTYDMLDNMSRHGLVGPGIGARHTAVQAGIERARRDVIVQDIAGKPTPVAFLHKDQAGRALKDTLVDNYEQARAPMMEAYAEYFGRMADRPVMAPSPLGTEMVQIGTVGSLNKRRSDLLKLSDRTTDFAKQRDILTEANDVILPQIESALSVDEMSEYAVLRSAFRAVEERHNNDLMRWLRLQGNEKVLAKIMSGDLPAVVLRGMRRSLNADEMMDMINNVLPERERQLFRAAAGMHLINESKNEIENVVRIDGEKMLAGIKKMGERFDKIFGDSAGDIAKFAGQLAAGQRHLRSAGARVGTLFLGLRQTGAAVGAVTVAGATIAGGPATGAATFGTILLAPPLMAKVLTSPRFARLATKMVAAKTPLAQRRALRQLNNAWSRWILFDQHTQSVRRREQAAEEQSSEQITGIAQTMFPGAAAGAIPEPPK
jgi:hypothetical protein